MNSDLSVPGSTCRSRMKVRTPRGHVQPLKAPCLPGGPSMPCRAAFRPQTSSLHRLRTVARSAVCARSARAGQLQFATVPTDSALFFSRFQSLPRPGWAPDPLMVGIRSPDGLVVGLAPATLEFWVRFPFKREEPGKTGRHSVLKYRVPHGPQKPWRYGST
jgi:hypothetical protein